MQKSLNVHAPGLLTDTFLSVAMDNRAHQTHILPSDNCVWLR